MLNLVCMGFSMIDQELIDRIKSELDEDWQVKTELVCSLLDNYIKLIEQNAELHKENEKNKSDASKLYDLCANGGACPEYLRVNFAN